MPGAVPPDVSQAIASLVLALGGFSTVGLLWLGVGIVAAVVIRLKVQESTAFLAHLALRHGHIAPE